MESASKHFREERMPSCIKCFLPLACIHPPTCTQPTAASYAAAAAAAQFGEIDLNNMKLDKRKRTAQWSATVVRLNLMIAVGQRQILPSFFHCSL